MFYIEIILLYIWGKYADLLLLLYMKYGTKFKEWKKEEDLKNDLFFCILWIQKIVLNLSENYVLKYFLLTEIYYNTYN